MMKKIIVIIIILFTMTSRGFSKKISFGVHISSDQITFLDGNPVEIYINIENKNDFDVVLPVYNADYTTFQPVVFDEKGREVSTAVKYRLMNRSIDSAIKNINPRKVVLGPGESLNHKVDLRKLYNLKEGGKYRVRGFFLYDIKKRILLGSDNFLYLSIASKEISKNIEDMGQLKRVVSPSEVVRLFLVAEKEEKWNNYLKYIKFEKYINAFSDYSLAYNSGSKAVKKTVLRDFIEFISKTREDFILKFNIINESIIDNSNIAYVDVKVKRYGGAYPFTYIYKYTLEKYKELWLISGVEASVTRELEND